MEQCNKLIFYFYETTTSHANNKQFSNRVSCQGKFSNCMFDSQVSLLRHSRDIRISRRYIYTVYLLKYFWVQVNKISHKYVGHNLVTLSFPSLRGENVSESLHFLLIVFEFLDSNALSKTFLYLYKQTDVMSQNMFDSTGTSIIRNSVVSMTPQHKNDVIRDYVIFNEVIRDSVICNDFIRDSVVCIVMLFWILSFVMMFFWILSFVMMFGILSFVQ